MAASSNSMGDGVLVEFASAVDGVECAVELQAAMHDANDALPEYRRIILRIGINLGYVMVEGGNLFGDGVNVAARLGKSTLNAVNAVSEMLRSKIVHFRGASSVC
jgi:class 3 adenylate cyclase